MPLNVFSDIFLQQLRQKPHAVAYRFFKGGVDAPDILTRHDLWCHAGALAQEMLAHGAVGDRVLLACQSQRHFVVAFYACLLSGRVAVPTPLPKRQQLSERLHLLASDAGVRGILSDSTDVFQLVWDEAARPAFQFDLRTEPAFEPGSVAAADWLPPVVDSAAIAFLQYTSGSVGDPQGVAVSHASLLQNCRVIEQAMAVTPDTAGLFALPLFHDLGLVGGVLQPMFTGCEANLMQPAEFVQYPERWLEIISRYRIAISGGPNFMYELAARALEDDQLQGLDLSCWRVAVCGAEPIRFDTVERFVARFAPVGFDADAFYPCYGMAESTLFISGPAVGSRTRVVPGPNGAKVVGCGKPWGDTRIEIVDPDSLLPVAPGAVGEVWVAGGSIASGYWMRPEQTAQAFAGRLAQDDGVDFLRTGDLAFMQDGDLYITGRLKDLIIVYGKKFAPQDLESHAERSHAGLRPAASAAFSVEVEGRACVALVCEVTREWWRQPEQWAELQRAVRDAVSAQFGVKLDFVMPIKPGTLPRTSSGKVRRSQCRLDFSAGKFDVDVDVPLAPAQA
jgi:acyl-CoA synthetase (AMP-forming)/AMP-acid ligase II